MFIWDGIELLGCTHATRKGIRNNVMYRVVEVGEDVTVARIGNDSELISLTFTQVGALLRLSYAQTYASCQGTEFDGSLRLYDTTNKHFTMRHLFVALSRSKRKDMIDISD